MGEWTRDLQVVGRLRACGPESAGAPACRQRPAGGVAEARGARGDARAGPRDAWPAARRGPRITWVRAAALAPGGAAPHTPQAPASTAPAFGRPAGLRPAPRPAEPVLLVGEGREISGV